MPKYIVFDVETPNRYNNRMNAIGSFLLLYGSDWEEGIRKVALEVNSNETSHRRDTFVGR